MAYVRLVRPHWFLASSLAAMIGIVQAWSEGSSGVALAALIVFGVIIHHSIMETWDELQDYAHYREEVVTESTEPPTLFSGGSGVLTGRLLTVAQVWRFFYVTLGIALVMLAGIIALAGWQVLLCVAAGVFVTINYNAVLKLSYRGFGEFANFISFGPIMVCSTNVVMKLGAHHAHAAYGWDLLRLISAPTAIESVIVGAIWFGSLHIQEMLDYDEDRAGSKKTLVVRFGKHYASCVPAVTAVVILALTAYLSTIQLGFLVVFPAALLHLCETMLFMMRWQDRSYFMRKLKSFFVYRNFVLICSSFLLSFLLRKFPHAAGHTAFVALMLLTLASSMPAAAFLAQNRLFAFAAGRETVA
jgi:1,4-dihydroxy-2-naphthoate octaprenyltransferase